MKYSVRHLKKATFLYFDTKKAASLILFSWKLDLFENQMGGDMERMCLAGGTGVIQAVSLYCDRVHFYHPITTSDQFLLNKLNLLGSNYTPPDTPVVVECDEGG